MVAGQAAHVLAQLERVEELIARKRQIFSWYREGLDGLDGVTLNFEAENTRNTYWMVTVVLDRRFGCEKERVIEAMSEVGIDCRPFFYPLSSLPAYADHPEAHKARQRNHISYRMSPFGVNLPSALNMTQEKVKYVCSALREFLRERSSSKAVPRHAA